MDQIVLNEKLINKKDVVDADFLHITCNKIFKDRTIDILYADFYQIMNVTVRINNFLFQYIIAYIHGKVELFLVKNQGVYSNYFLQKKLDKICTFYKEFFCSTGSFRKKFKKIS